MLIAQALDIDAWRHPIDDPPLSGHHDPVGAMGAAQYEGGERIAGAGEAQLIEREQGKVGLAARFDPADVVTAEAAGRAFRRPAQRIEMADRRIIGQPIDHERMAHALHEIGIVIRGGAIDAKAHRHAGSFEIARAALARGQDHIRGWAMAHRQLVPAKPSDLAVVEMNAMRQPHIGREPARLLQIVHRAAAEMMLAIGRLVLRLGNMGVKPAAMAATEKGEQGARAIWIMAPSPFS